MERVGVFGGTFDPVHIGHLAAAVEVRHALGLDRVLLVVAREPWQKVGTRDISAAEDRFAVVAAAVADLPGLEASRIEIDRPGPTFTVDTLDGLTAPGRELFLILGADAAAGLDTWDRVEQLASMATLAVVARPGAMLPELPTPYRVVNVPITSIDVSSTDLRDRAAAGRPLDVFVPEAALREARRRGLYPEGVDSAVEGR